MSQRCDVSKIPICDITPFTMQDFPNRTAAILWFGGCNMRCSYCHNPELVTGRKQRLPLEEVRSFLSSRRGLLDGVVLSGGECTMFPQLPSFIREVREDYSFMVKLDTNGLNPDMVEALLYDNLLDYVAIDYKAPRDKFSLVTEVDSCRFEDFHRSLRLLCLSGVELEIRTTVHTDLLGEDDIFAIIEDIESLGFSGTYYIQNYNHGEVLLGDMSEQGRVIDVSRFRGLGEKTGLSFTVDITRNF